MRKLCLFYVLRFYNDVVLAWSSHCVGSRLNGSFYFKTWKIGKIWYTVSCENGSLSDDCISSESDWGLKFVLWFVCVLKLSGAYLISCHANLWRKCYINDFYETWLHAAGGWACYYLHFWGQGAAWVCCGLNKVTFHWPLLLNSSFRSFYLLGLYAERHSQRLLVIISHLLYISTSAYYAKLDE